MYCHPHLRATHAVFARQRAGARRASTSRVAWLLALTPVLLSPLFPSLIAAAEVGRVPVAQKVKVSASDEVGGPSLRQEAPSNLPWGELQAAESIDADINGLPPDFVFGCPSSLFGHVEAFALNREGDSGASLSDNFGLGGFGYERGARVTVGRAYDCLDGWELSFVGPFKWDLRGEFTGNAVNSRFLPAGGLTGADVSAFVNTAFQRQRFTSELNSFEFNKKWWGWDVISTSVGLRYVNIREKLNLFSVGSAPGADQGLFSIDTNNHLAGIQFGAELYQPIGNRWSFGGKLKLGPYGTFSDKRTRLTNAGLQIINNDADRAQLAFLGEGGFFANFRLTQRITLWAGYEAWYVYGVALAAEQAFVPMSPQTGTSTKKDGDIFYHGGTAGVQYAW